VRTSVTPIWFHAGALASVKAALEAGVADQQAVCEISFKRLPPTLGFLVMAGVQVAMQTVERAIPKPHEMSLMVAHNLAEQKVLERFLGNAPWVNINAVPDGSLVFGGEPVVQVEGKVSDVLVVCYLIASILEFHTTIATRTARSLLATGYRPIVEASSLSFTETAQCLQVASAAYMGGASGTMFIPAALHLGIPLRSVVPHPWNVWEAKKNEETGDSWGSHGGEEFRLVPPSANEQELSMWLADYQGGLIVSHLHHSLGLQARIDLVAQEQGVSWASTLGVAGESHVVPGKKILVRYVDENNCPLADIAHLISEKLPEASQAEGIGFPEIGVPMKVAARRSFPLLQSMMRSGKRVGGTEDLAEARQRTLNSLALLKGIHTDLHRPKPYWVGISSKLAAAKEELVRKM
jgi:nicotinate phosphoribosyltransferase